MPCQLPLDCLSEIFEFLEEDKVTLHSCLLVNRPWCEVSVRILWRDIFDSKYFKPARILDMLSQIFNTLIACLPDESKDLLHKKKAFILTPTSKPPLFNYASFCKILSIDEINTMVEVFLDNQQIITSRNFHKDLVIQEILNMFMKQISSLKKLTWYYYEDTTFTHFPGVIGCLTNLSELDCSSDVHPEFFRQLSQTCHNILSLQIEFKVTISSGFMDLISSQNSLKFLSLKKSYNGRMDLAEVIPSLTNHKNTITKLLIDGILFKELQYVTFPQLQILKFHNNYPNVEALIKFMENNGKNLKEFYIYRQCNILNLAMASYCPNLKSLFLRILYSKIDTLKVIFDSCQQLESLEVWCGGLFLIEKEVLEITAKYSPENCHELKLHFCAQSKLVSSDLESFFIGWKNRTPHKSLTIIIIKHNGWELNNEHKSIIEKYKKLGTIKKFE